MSTLLKRAYNYLDDNFECVRSIRRKCGIVRVKGVFEAECRDKDGNVKWKAKALNGSTNFGLQSFLENFFRASSNQTPWYISLVGATSYTTGFAVGDTSASHGGWAEFTNYSAGNRVAWGPAAAANGVITNTVAVAFTMTAGETLKGFFCINQNTKGGTTGVLWATALFATGDQVVVSTDVVNVTYTITLS